MDQSRQLRIYFDFILRLPYVPLDGLPFDELICMMCEEDFEDSQWKPEETMKNPVPLSCGHIVGIRYLTRYIFSLNFVDECPLCHGVLSDNGPFTLRILPREQSNEMFRTLVAAGVFAENGVPARGVGNAFLLNSLQNGWNPFTAKTHKGDDRAMMIYEEVLGSEKFGKPSHSTVKAAQNIQAR